MRTLHHEPRRQSPRCHVIEIFVETCRSHLLYHVLYDDTKPILEGGGAARARLKDALISIAKHLAEAASFLPRYCSS